MTAYGGLAIAVVAAQMFGFPFLLHSDIKRWGLWCSVWMVVAFALSAFAIWGMWTA